MVGLYILACIKKEKLGIYKATDTTTAQVPIGVFGIGVLFVYYI